MLTCVFVISTIMQVGVAYHIYVRGHKNPSYLYFFLLSVVTWLWVVLNYLSITLSASPLLTYVVRAIMLVAVIQTSLFYIFALKFPYGSYGKDLRLKIYAPLTFLAATASVSPFMFRSVQDVHGSISIKAGPALLFFIIHICYSVTVAFGRLIKKYRRSAGMQRAQLLLLICAASINWIIVPFTNFVATLAYKTIVFVDLSPLYGLLFSSIIGFALTRHYLFNFNRVLSDSTIYVDYYLNHDHNRNLQYYQLQTLAERADSRQIILDYSGMRDLDDEAISLIRTLRLYLSKQGKTLYHIGLNQRVFQRLKLANEIKIYK